MIKVKRAYIISNKPIEANCLPTYFFDTTCSLFSTNKIIAFLTLLSKIQFKFTLA